MKLTTTSGLAPVRPGATFRRFVAASILVAMALVTRNPRERAVWART
jgi:hypothetical protein